MAHPSSGNRLMYVTVYGCTIEQMLGVANNSSIPAERQAQRGGS
jgi:hypothetical protein